MKDKSDIPVVSIVGRPNVGKSSLFNRLLGTRHSVVEKKEGTTRDRIEKLLSIKEKRFILVDTGGFSQDGMDEIVTLVRKQIEKAILTSDILLFVCDGGEGLLPLDTELGLMLRKSNKKIILSVNKIDNEKRKENLFDFYELGLGEPLGTSALHDTGIKRLQSEICNLLPERSETEIDDKYPIKVAIVGRPNVGKSSFLNKVLGEERVLVHEKAGTTRDSVDTYFKKEGLLFLLIDTAGIRHKRKVKEPVDIYSMMRARDSIDRSDVAILLIDGLEGVTNDDAKIFDYIKIKGIGCIIAVNKWDLVKNIEMQKYEQAIFRKMPEAKNFPIVFTSAKTGRNVPKAFDLVKVIKTNLDLFINTNDLRRFLKEIMPENVTISKRRSLPKFHYMVCAKIFPKEFVIFVNNPERVTYFHSSFIENRLRERFPLEGVPIKLIYKKPTRRKRA